MFSIGTKMLNFNTNYLLEPVLNTSLHISTDQCLELVIKTCYEYGLETSNDTDVLCMDSTFKADTDVWISIDFKITRTKVDGRNPYSSTVIDTQIMQ